MTPRSLKDLLAEQGQAEVDAPPQLPKKGTQHKQEVPDSDTSEVRDSRGATATPAAARKPPRATGRRTVKGPKWQALEAKETRLWPDQLAALTELRRRLKRERPRGASGAETITENTLIRVAVAFMLEHEQALSGVNERELLNSLRSGVLNSGIPDK